MVKPSFIKSLNIEDEMNVKDWIIEIICYNKLAIFLRKVGRFLLRVLRWLPVLWKQEEWDFGFTYDILEFKLKEIRKCIAKDTWHVKEEVEEELKQIDSCLDHLDKYRNWTEYIEIPETPREWGEPPKDPEIGLHEWRITKEQEEAFKKAIEFERENYIAFWDDLKNNSSNWWT